VKVLDASAVERHLGMRECIELMDRTQRALSRGDVRIPLRTGVPVAGGRGVLLLMPGEAGSPPVFGAKILSVFPENEALPAIQGWILLFDPADGAPLALVEAASVTAIRTAAASAVATRVLARSDAETLVLLGCGVQAASHLEAMLVVRRFREVLVWGPTPARARAFADSQAAAHGIPVEPIDEAARAVARGDVICAVSAAREPIVHGNDLKPGCHVNLVGAHTPDTREADARAFERARVFTEVTEFALAEAGDLLMAIAEGAFSADRIEGEIGAVLEGTVAGRTGAAEITLYKSLGNVAQDLAAASHVLARSRDQSSRGMDS